MSNPTKIASSAVPFAISSDGITYKNVVCKKVWNLSSDVEISAEETDCGRLTSVGTPGWTFDAEFVLNTTPNGATEWGYDALFAFHNAGTLIYVKTTSGSSYYRQGQGYITSWKETANQGGMVTAQITFTGDGTLDITA